MKLVGSMMLGPGEFDRYASMAIGSLLEFCDVVCVRYENTGAPPVTLGERVAVMSAEPTFFQHEGRARQELLDFTLRQQPTHVICVDADEFISDGAALRQTIETNPGFGAFEVKVEEVWKADSQLWIREDGQWGNRRSPLLYRVPRSHRGLRIANRALASGREPVQVARDRRPYRTDASLLHFGWACVADRQARYDRYVTHDGGRFHRNTHLDSIMWDDARVKLVPRGWPQPLDAVRDRIVERANRQAAIAHSERQE